MPSIRTIELSNNYVAIVDACDFDGVNAHKWSAVEARPGITYGLRHQVTADGRVEAIYLHRQLLGLQSGDARIVDHISHVGTDCRRMNLRVCTPSQNQMWRGRNKNNRSGFKGISYFSSLSASRRWVARISIDGVQTVIGHYGDPVSAAVAWDLAAATIHGEYAFQNFPASSSALPIAA